MENCDDKCFVLVFTSKERWNAPFHSTHQGLSQSVKDGEVTTTIAGHVSGTFYSNLHIHSLLKKHFGISIYFVYIGLGE